MTRLRRAAAASLLAFAVAAPALACMPPPYQAEFRKHHVATYTGPTKEVDFASHPVGAELDEAQKALVRASVKHGANFAGTYRLVQMRCGDRCTRILVVSLETGKIHRVPVDGHVSVDYRTSSKFLVIRAMDGERRVTLLVFENGAFRSTQAES